MTICPQCNAEFKIDSKLCLECGTQTVPSQQSPTEERAADQTAMGAESNSETTPVVETIEPSLASEAETAATPAVESAGSGADTATQPKAKPGKRNVRLRRAVAPEGTGRRRLVRAALAFAAVSVLVGAAVLGYAVGQQRKDAAIQELAAANKVLSEQLSERNAMLGDQLIANNIMLSENNKKLSARAEELEDNNARLSASNAQIAASNKQLATSNKGLNESNKELTEKTGKLSSDKEQLKAANDTLRVENAALKSGKSRRDTAANGGKQKPSKSRPATTPVRYQDRNRNRRSADNQRAPGNVNRRYASNGSGGSGGKGVAGR